MAIIAKFKVTGCDLAKYEAVIERLTQMGLLRPPGQLYHICYGDPSDIQVINVFESPEAMAAFGQKLMPLIGEYGISAELEIFPVHNLISS